jgi:FkbM family methyltransferase
MKTFLEIGSCDFDTLSYLSKYGWSGVIVEPIKKYFNNLTIEENIHYVNAAVDWEDGTTTMWTADDSLVSIDRDYAGMSSICNKDYKLPTGEYVLTNPIEVQTISFKTLIGMTQLKHIDYLKIDTEGYDLEILKMFPWDEMKPSFIKFESKHIDIDTAVDLLTYHGYHCEVDVENTYAIKL